MQRYEFAWSDRWHRYFSTCKWIIVSGRLGICPEAARAGARTLPNILHRDFKTDFVRAARTEGQLLVSNVKRGRRSHAILIHPASCREQERQSDATPCAANRARLLFR